MKKKDKPPNLLILLIEWVELVLSLAFGLFLALLILYYAIRLSYLIIQPLG